MMLQSFEDILEPRRLETSNFLWVSRQLSTKAPCKQTRRVKPSEMKLAVLNSEKIKILIEKQCAKEKLSREQVINTIKQILDEIGYKKQLELIRWLGLVIAKISTQVCSSINVNRESIMTLRNGMGNVPMMYVPSHRSYADFILMSYICFHYDIEIPAIAAGMDFHGMKGMGTILRNTGAFFMRRSYNDDNIYWDTFKEYVHQIVVKGELGIEFFIEGTRSRSGKSLYPKFGLFSMILKAFFNGEVPDILFVPINITYERVMEERLFAFELLGVPKPKESTSAEVAECLMSDILICRLLAEHISEEFKKTFLLTGQWKYNKQMPKSITENEKYEIMVSRPPSQYHSATAEAFFKSLSLIKEKYGNVYVNFGTPISAYQFFNDKIDRTVHCSKPLYMQTSTESERKATSLLAESIVRHQQKLCVITTFNLVAIIILEYFIYKNAMLTVGKLVKEVTWLKEIIERFGAVTNFTDDPKKVLDALQVHCNLIKLCDDGEIKLARSAETMEIDRTKLKGHQLQNEIMARSVTAITIQLYVNPCLHYFINSSLITTILRRHSEDGGILKDVLFAEYSFLRAVFKKEFVLFQAYEQLEFGASMDMLKSVEVITGDNCIRLCSNEKLQQLLCNLLQPFFITYYTVCSILRGLDVNECTELQIYSVTQGQIEKLLYANVTIHPYTLSLDTISICLQSLNDLKAIKKVKRNTSTIYVAQTETLSWVIKKLDDYVIYLIPGFKLPVSAKL